MKRLNGPDKKRGVSLPVAYIVFSLVCMFALIAIFQLFKGRLIDNWFYSDSRDTGMDFFHSIEYVRGRDPYGSFDVLYPPLANLLFLFIYNMIPRSVSANWAPGFWESIGARGTNADLRTFQAPMIIFLVFILLCAYLIVKVTEHSVSDQKPVIRGLLSFCVLFSYGILQCVERGNILLLSWVGVFYFLLNYQSDSPILRETAALALAVSAGLKLYPAFFGILLLDKKQYSLAARTILYGVLCIVLPVFLFKGGLSNLKGWLDTVFSFSASRVSWVGIGMVNILENANMVLMQFFGVSINFLNYQIVTYCIVLLLFLSVFFLKREWKKILALTIAMCIWTTQGEYIFCFFLLPLLIMFGENSTPCRETTLDFICLTLLTVDIPLFYRVNMYYHRNTLAQIVVSVLIVSIVIEGFGSKIRHIIKCKT